MILQKWLETARVYFDRRMLTMLGLGFSSGFPFLLVGGTLALWLTDAQVGIEIIGLFALVKIPYSFKWLWSPLTDRLRLPFFSRFGRRRGWALFSQTLLILSILAMAAVNPANSVYLMMFLAALAVFASATQDIVLDAFRVESFTPEEQGAGAAIFILGYRIGFIFSGAIALLLAAVISWNEVYVLMSLGAIIGIISILFCREPETGAAPQPIQGRTPLQKLKNFYLSAVKAPIADFIRRRDWKVIVLFVMVYKLCDSYMAPMSMPFYDAMGFSKEEIAYVTKIFGMIATIVGGLWGGLVVKRHGIVKSLILGSLLQGATTLMFVVQTYAGHNLGVLMLTISLDNLAGGMSTTFFVAYISSLCNVTYTATQYALLSSFMSLVRDLLSSTSGFLVQLFSWQIFFIITTLMSLPGLLLIFYMKKHGGLKPYAEAAHK